MEELIPWLTTIERKAGELYAGAALLLKNEPELVTFLNRLAEDEKLHLQTLEKAAGLLQNGTLTVAEPLLLDGSVTAGVETPFDANLEKLRQGVLTKDDVLECLAATEFSEWNQLFLYVVNLLKSLSREFQYVAARMQHHQTMIETFLATQPAGRRFLEKLRNLQPVWRERILVMDDSEPIRELLSMMLEGMGQVETAGDGEEGLRKVRENFYDLIISDVNTPRLGGLDFYREAVKIDPEIGGRFLFYTGFPTEEAQAFFTENRLRYLLKPAPIQAFRQAAAKILVRNQPASCCRGERMPGL